MWKFCSVAQLVESQSVEFITYPEQLSMRAYLSPLRLVLSVTKGSHFKVLSYENCSKGFLDLKTYLGSMFGFTKLALKVVSLLLYLEWLAG